MITAEDLRALLVELDPEALFTLGKSTATDEYVSEAQPILAAVRTFALNDVNTITGIVLGVFTALWGDCEDDNCNTATLLTRAQAERIARAILSAQ
jgi:hypothetical protein